MKKTFLPTCTAAILMWTGISACAGIGPAGGSQNTSLEEVYQEKALALEQKGELPQALLAWRIAASLNPDNTLTPKIIASLTDTITTQAKQHFEQGRDHFHKGDFDQARRSFLITLHLSPEHEGALGYLKKQLISADRKIYKVQPGDSFSKIAAQFYRDYSKAYAIAYFNNLDPKKSLLVDTQLIIPELPAPYLISASSSAKDQKSSPVQKPPGDAATRKRAEESNIRAAKDKTNYQLGLNLIAKKQYAEALAIFQIISPEFRGRDQAIVKSQALIKEQAQKQAMDAALKEAERRIADKKYEAALTILEEVLSKAPANIRARRLIDQARYAWAQELIAQRNEAQAIELLLKLDKAYQDTEDLLTQVRAKLSARAETYYRKGVKHFLNEELELAIEYWEKALSLNPDHPKAAGDMQNAMRLLKKWQDLDETNPDTPEKPSP